MVERSAKLNAIFHSLSHPVRRDILKRLGGASRSIQELAEPYGRSMSFAAVAKHIEVLANAGLVEKRRSGREQLVAGRPASLDTANALIEEYQRLWERRMDRLEEHVRDNP